MDANYESIPYGARYEITRVVTAFKSSLEDDLKFTDVTIADFEKFRALVTNADAAPQALKDMLSKRPHAEVREDDVQGPFSSLYAKEIAANVSSYSNSKLTHH